MQRARVIDAELMEYDREFVHQCDIDVALGVFDDFGGFGDLDRRGAMDPGYVLRCLREKACGSAMLLKPCANESAVDIALTDCAIDLN